jgi:hypothetical protein
MDRKLIVTHHAPDLDAVSSVWLLKRFDSQHYANAQIAFVNPGEEITLEEAEEQGHQLHEVTHVDTGLGKFDHHQAEKAGDTICAATLVYDHCISIHPELKDDEALQIIVKFVTEIDHFKEIYWHEANDTKYNFMIHDLIRGLEFFDPHNDDSQLHFGMTCLDSAYATLTQRVKAEEIIKEKGQEFEIKTGKALALDTRNDDTLKMAQKMGYALVVRKDTKLGHVRIKVRPDIDMDLKPLHEKIIAIDKKGTWFYHASGKMLINGSIKHRNQTPSPLPLNEVVAIIKETYA